MPDNRDDVLLHYQGSREELLSAIDGLSDELLTEPSLDGWSVKDHLIHVAVWDDLRTSEILRISAGYEPAWPRSMTREQVESYNTLTHDLRQGLSLDQARWELETSRQRLVDVLSSVPEQALDASLYGHLGLRSSHEAEHVDMIRRWRQEKGV